MRPGGAIRPRDDCGARRARHADAIEHFERAIALFPEFGAAHYALARAYRAQGRREDAEAALRAHGQFGARWPAVADPVSPAVSALRDDPAALLPRGVKQADAGTSRAAIAVP